MRSSPRFRGTQQKDFSPPWKWGGFSNAGRKMTVNICSASCELLSEIFLLLCMTDSWFVSTLPLLCPKAGTKGQRSSRNVKTQNSIHHPQALLLSIFHNIFMSGRAACDERIYGSNSLFLHSHHILWSPASLKHLTSLFQPSAATFQSQCLKYFCPCSLITPTGFIC